MNCHLFGGKFKLIYYYKMKVGWHKEEPSIL